MCGGVGRREAEWRAGPLGGRAEQHYLQTMKGSGSRIREKYHLTYIQGEEIIDIRDVAVASPCSLPPSTNLPLSAHSHPHPIIDPGARAM